MKHFDHPSDQAAFERWVDVTAELLQKYGPVFLKQMEAMKKARHETYECSTKILHLEQPANHSLETDHIAA